SRWVFVTPFPSRVSQGNCRFVFGDLPAGRYRLRGWHPTEGRRSRTVNVKVDAKVVVVTPLIYGGGAQGRWVRPRDAHHGRAAVERGRIRGQLAFPVETEAPDGVVGLARAGEEAAGPDLDPARVRVGAEHAGDGVDQIRAADLALGVAARAPDLAARAQPAGVEGADGRRGPVAVGGDLGRRRARVDVADGERAAGLVAPAPQAAAPLARAGRRLRAADLPPVAVAADLHGRAHLLRL